MPVVLKKEQGDMWGHLLPGGFPKGTGPILFWEGKKDSRRTSLKKGRGISRAHLISRKGELLSEGI